jgi:glycosyltransferase involved in cell wall biosynthesis
LSEGLPMSVIEAWAAATPTIISAGCNLAEGVSAGAALETGTTSAQIAAALDKAASLPNAPYAQMAEAALFLANTRFSLPTVAARWSTAYRGLAARV